MSRNWKMKQFYHTVINSRDLDRSIAFYEMIGFKVLHDRRNLGWPDMLAPLFGLRKAKGGGVLMVSESDYNGTMLDLIKWDIPQAEFPDPAKVPDLVPRLLAFRVEGIKELYKDLQSKGVKFTEGGLFEPPPGFAAMVASCFCYDPDGTLIEFIELLPGARHTQDKKGAGMEG